MLRRSSSSGSTPSRTAPPSRATAGGSSSSVAIQLVAQLRQVVELRREAAQERRLKGFEEHPEARHGGERLPQRDQIARPRGAERGAGDDPLHVVHGLQRLAHLRALGAAEREVLDAVEAILDALERGERPEQPGPDQAAAHRGAGPIDLVQQRSRAPAVGRFDHLERSAAWSDR